MIDPGPYNLNMYSVRGVIVYLGLSGRIKDIGAPGYVAGPGERVNSFKYFLTPLKYETI